MSKRLFTLGLLSISLAIGSTALAGPGSLPSYLLQRPAPKASEAPYALTGRATRHDGWTPRAEWIGGSRDQRSVFERGERVTGR